MVALFVLDGEGQPLAGDWTTVYWRGFAADPVTPAVSIPQLIEENALALRRRYLAWIRTLGETPLAGRRLLDVLELRPGFSYWWMTLFAEKCNYSKSPQIVDAIRLMAFDAWAEGRGVERVVLATADPRLAECLRLWCATTGAAFEWHPLAGESAATSLPRRIYRAMPDSLQAVLWLIRYLWQRWPLRGAGRQAWQETAGTTTFVSYLDNLVPEAAQAGRFASRYWAHLPDELQRQQQPTNWLHLYAADAVVPNARLAAQLIRGFNASGHGSQAHATLDTFLSLDVLLTSLRDWRALGSVGRRLPLARHLPEAGNLNLSPLFAEDWRNSISGPACMGNVISFNLLGAAFSALPKQRIGTYLQENQAWEFALVHAWRAAGHGRLIGAPHSTVRFWDLRYFFDPECYRRSGCNDLPLPDRVAVNGVAMRDEYLLGGYPESDLKEVEALRFLHLAKARPVGYCGLGRTVPKLRLLVLGEYLPANTRKQLLLLEQAMPLLPEGTEVILKPHPNCLIRPADYPGCNMRLTTAPIASLLDECDVAYTSSVTSAAVDAYCAGVPVVSYLDQTTLNLSPLRGRSGARFASSPAALADALVCLAMSRSNDGEARSFFAIDPSLDRWKGLLAASTNVLGIPAADTTLPHRKVV